VRRPIWIAAGALVVVALAAVLWLLRSLDARVERYIETAGSELLGAEVSLESVDVDLRAGRAVLRGLEIANPPGDELGFSDVPALRFGEIDATLDVASLAGDPIVLEAVSVGAPFANLEVTPGGLNLLVLSRNLDRARPAEIDAAAGEELPRRFRLRELRIAEGTLRADARAVGRDVREQPLPALSLSDFGGAGGATPAELGRQTLRAYLLSVLSQAATDRVSELLEQQLNKVKERIAEGLLSIFGTKKKE
jgi:hypothetical protein